MSKSAARDRMQRLRDLLFLPRPLLLLFQRRALHHLVHELVARQAGRVPRRHRFLGLDECLVSCRYMSYLDGSVRPRLSIRQLQLVPSAGRDFRILPPKTFLISRFLSKKKI